MAFDVSLIFRLSKYQYKLHQSEWIGDVFQSDDLNDPNLDSQGQIIIPYCPLLAMKEHVFRLLIHICDITDTENCKIHGTIS